MEEIQQINGYMFKYLLLQCIQGLANTVIYYSETFVGLMVVCQESFSDGIESNMTSLFKSYSVNVCVYATYLTEFYYIPETVLSSWDNPENKTENNLCLWSLFSKGSNRRENRNY